MIKEKYAKIFVEEATKKSLIEGAAYGQYLSAGEAYEYFIQPLKDILDVAKIALKDIGSGVLYNMRILFTFSTTKKARLLEAYNQSRENYKKQYEPIMDRIDKNLSEAELLFFLANPVGYIGKEVVVKGLDAGKFVADVFIEQSKARAGEGPSGPTKPEDGPLLGALTDLKRIFFGESLERRNLLESENQSGSVESQVSISMEAIGVDPGIIISDFSEWVSTKETIIRDIEAEDIPARISALVKMMQSQDYQSLEKAVMEAKSVGVDLGNYLKEFKSEFENSKSELLASLEQKNSDDPKSKKENSDILSKIGEMPKIKKLGDRATNKDYVEALEESLFVSLKSNLQTDGDKILNDINKEVSEISGIILGPFESIEELKDFKAVSPEAGEIASKMESAYKKITGT